MSDDDFREEFYGLVPASERSHVFLDVSTQGVPGPEQYDYWTSSVIYNFDVDRPNPTQRKSFHASIQTLATKTGELHDVRADSFTGERSQKKINADGAAELSIMYLLEGQIAGNYEGEPDFLIKPNEFFLFDATRPSRLQFDKNRMILLDLPRSEMQSLFAGPAPSPVLIGKALSRCKLAPMLRMQLEQFPKLAGALNDKEKLTLLDATEAFAMTIIEAACADIKQEYKGSHEGLVAAARSYIQLNLGDPHLNAQQVASALGCSRATLYRAFYQFDVSIADFIRELRLCRLQRLLLDPRQDFTIAQLAYRCGFFDSFNIHRLYKKRFGITPSEQRKLGQDGADK